MKKKPLTRTTNWEELETMYSGLQEDVEQYIDELWDQDEVILGLLEQREELISALQEYAEKEHANKQKKYTVRKYTGEFTIHFHTTLDDDILEGPFAIYPGQEFVLRIDEESRTSE